MSSATLVRWITATAGTLAALPDDLLEDIFLRLDDAADHARASTCCTAFRRIISGRRFLRRCQSLHPPPVLGFLDCTRVIVPGGVARGRICAFYQAEPAHRSSLAASQVARATDFTFPFLPDLRSWSVVDFRDGRVLLSGHAADAVSSSIFENLVVYDPLHRRHVQLPAIPQETKRHHGDVTHVETFLVPVTDDEKDKDDDQPIRVICNVFTKEKIWAYIFSSATGIWRVPTAFAIAQYHWLRLGYQHRTRHYACSCFFWTAFCPPVMLVLETGRDDDGDMKFSIVNLPPPPDFCCELHFAVVEAENGRLGVLVLRDDKLDFYSKSMQDGVGTGEWRRDISTSNPLPSCYLIWSISKGGAAGGHILIRTILRNRLSVSVGKPKSGRKRQYAYYFTLELKTLLVERLCVLKLRTSHDFLYVSFTPPLSLPSI